MRLIEPRREPDRVDRTPEAVAGMRIIVAEIRRPLPGGGADKDETQIVLKLVGEAVHGQKWRGRRQSAWCLAHHPVCRKAVSAAQARLCQVAKPRRRPCGRSPGRR